MQGKAAKLLSDRREELGLTQHQVAQRAGVREYDVSRWERGAVKSLPLAGIYRVCRALDLNLERVGELLWEDLTSGEAGELGPAASPSEASDEAAVAGDARRADRQPRPKRRGSTRRPES